MSFAALRVLTAVVGNWCRADVMGAAVIAALTPPAVNWRAAPIGFANTRQVQSRIIESVCIDLCVTDIIDQIIIEIAGLKALAA